MVALPLDMPLSPGPPQALAKSVSHGYQPPLRGGGQPHRLRFRPVGTQGFCSFEKFALPSCTARVLKAQVRVACDELAGVPDERLRLLYRGVELPDDGPIRKHLPEAVPGGVVDLQFMLIGRPGSGPEVADHDCSLDGLSVCEGVPARRPSRTSSRAAARRCARAWSRSWLAAAREACTSCAIPSTGRP
eukprot:SRR837773.7744.p1 GENE.SRR837773.7744~~SRR837773.7744.p1  ORF type:complete len:212 (+),score=22.88 SRR837773.7744:72-638(+)